MGALSGNTGFVKFNSYVDLLDDTDPYNIDWAQLTQLGTADAPTATSPYQSYVAYWGYSSAPSGYDSVGSRCKSSNLNASVPVGAFLSGFEVRVRGGGTWASGNTYAYWYDIEPHFNGTTIGNTKTPNTQLADTSSSGNSLSTHTQGSSSDKWGVTIGSGKANDANFGFKFRCRYTDSNGGGSTYGPLVDYFFGNFHWKQTGVMLCM